MRDLTSLPAEKILKITDPEVLFSGIEDTANAEYKALAKRWHPDLEQLAIGSRVFAHVVHLHREALRKISNGTWLEPCEKIEDEVRGVKSFRKVDGTLQQIHYTAIREFELGAMLIADHYVAFEVREEYLDLMRAARSQIKQLTFANPLMAQELSICLPQVIDSFRAKHSAVLIVRKTPDQILLSDILNFENGKLRTIEHTGWIINVLLNIACYLEWANLTHNAIAASTFFVSPLRHTGMLLGGWWYSVRPGERLAALPDSSLSSFPADILRNKEADRRGDFESIKAVLFALLGQTNDAQLLHDKALPASIREFLLLPARKSAAEDYAFWKYKVLSEAFGRPKFIRWDLSSKEIYKES